jgi:hypothetical protein
MINAGRRLMGSCAEGAAGAIDRSSIFFRAGMGNDLIVKHRCLGVKVRVKWIYNQRAFARQRWLLRIFNGVNRSMT